MIRRRAAFLVLALGFGLLVPLYASAHEVYVLSSAEIAQAIATPAFNEGAVVAINLSQFVLWAFVAILTVFVVFCISVARGVERMCDPFLRSLRRFAAPIARVTIGLSFLAAAYYQAIFGPELPLASVFGALAGLATALLVVLGVLLVFGIYVRLAAIGALALFAVVLWEKGVYLLTYTNYLGEILVLVGIVAAQYRFALLRVCFGTALLYASFYAKVLHNNLALLVAELPLAGHTQSLAYAFGLEPHFVVLGAAIVEIVIALFFIFGIEIRFTSLFLLFWLSLSLLYFGEAVWPHIILIGIPIALICYGYDTYSLEGRFFRRGALEPVL